MGTRQGACFRCPRRLCLPLRLGIDLSCSLLRCAVSYARVSSCILASYTVSSAMHPITLGVQNMQFKGSENLQASRNGCSLSESITAW